MRILWELFITFAKIGGLTFGGGMAMLPMFQREIVEKKHWVTEEDLLDYYAVAQCTPGIIAVNTATFTGNKVNGIPGAAAATAGVVFPSLVIISLIAGILKSLAGAPAVQNAFSGIQVCVCVLVCNSVIKLVKKSVTDCAGVIIFAAVMIMSLILHISPVVFVAAAVICGILIGNLREKRS